MRAFFTSINSDRLGCNLVRRNHWTFFESENDIGDMIFWRQNSILWAWLTCGANKAVLLRIHPELQWNYYETSVPQVISKNSDVIWPPRSTDLTTSDFFFVDIYEEQGLCKKKTQKFLSNSNQIFVMKLCNTGSKFNEKCAQKSLHFPYTIAIMK